MTFNSPQELSDLNYALYAAISAADQFLADEAEFNAAFPKTKQRRMFKERVERWRDLQRKIEEAIQDVENQETNSEIPDG